MAALHVPARSVGVDETVRVVIPQETGLIDYDELEKMAKIYKPKMIVAGASAYPRDFDYARCVAACVHGELACIRLTVVFWCVSMTASVPSPTPTEPCL